MSRTLKIVLTVIVIVLTLPIVGYFYVLNQDDPFLVLFNENCSVCHGERLEGTPQGTALVGIDLQHGESVAELRHSIAEGFPSLGMPAWSDLLNEGQISSLAIFVAENRLNFDFTDYKVHSKVVIPDEIIESEQHNFRIEVFATDLDPLPYSIAPLPEGGFLLTEKTRGLSVISPEGIQSAMIEGTPQAHGDGLKFDEIQYGLGWLLDVALHPQYETNGWVYLHYTDRCSDECDETGEESILPVSMNRLDRGRIDEGMWVDTQTIWQADPETYSSVPDVVAGGRIAFDDEGHVFISVGMKGGYIEGIQDLNLPYGKIHRINDDGSIPPDNPFVIKQRDSDVSSPYVPIARQTIWNYGFRSPQGLEFNFQTGELWGTDHGPRGGDEVNRLLPGKNYGWPLYSKGVDYDGTPVEWGEDLNIEFDLKDIEQPVVDFTPSPAISSFIFYEGDTFPRWRHNIIVGSLKATELYRLVIENNKLIHKETLIKNLARIRDIEIGYDGLIYLLLENNAGSEIVRLVPEQ